MTVSIDKMFDRQDVVEFGDDGPVRRVHFTFDGGELGDLRMALHAAEHYFADNQDPGYEKWTEAVVGLRRIFFDAETWAKGGRK